MTTALQAPTEQVDIPALESELTAMQLKLVNAWLGEAKGNGLQAAKIAGYGTDTSSDAALSVATCQVLALTKVQAYIQAMMHGMGINPQAMMLQLHEGIYGNAFEGMDLGNLKPSDLSKLQNSRLIKRLTVTQQEGVNGTMTSVSIEPVDRAEYIKLAMRALGMDIRKVEVTGAGGGPMLIKQVQPPVIHTEQTNIKQLSTMSDIVEGTAKELIEGPSL